MSGAARPAGEIALATSRLGTFLLALPLGQVCRLAAWEDLRPEEGASCLDLGKVVQAQGGRTPRTGRRVAGLAGGAEGGELLVLLGEAVAVRSAELRAVFPLPALLEQAGARFGCAGLVLQGEEVCFLLDAERLRAVARAG